MKYSKIRNLVVSLRVGQELTIQQLADVYDASTPEVRKWMHENVHLWKEYFAYPQTPINIEFKRDLCNFSGDCMTITVI